MSHVYRVCLFVMVTLLVTAFQTTPTEPPPEPTAGLTASAAFYPLPDNLQFHYQGQTPEHEAQMRAGVQAAYNYLRSIGLEADAAPVDLYAYEDSNLLVNDLFEHFGQNELTFAMQRNLQSGHSGGHGYGLSVVWTGFPPFQLLSQSPRGVDVNIWYTVQAGNYIEAVLENLAGNRPLSATGGQPNGEPAWIILGFSDYLFRRAIDAAGIADNYYLEYRASYRWENRAYTIALRDLELYNATNDPSRLGFLGAEYLAAQSGDGALLEFYRSINRTGNRYDAFRAAFGMSITEFYQAYQVYRREHYPVFYQNIGGTVVDAQGNGLDIWLWACPPQPTYDCYPVRAAINAIPGSFAIAVPQGDILLAFGTTVKPESIFGYYRQVEDAPPTPIPGDRFLTDYYVSRGTVTPNRGEATLITVSSQTVDTFSFYNTYVQLPPNLP